MYGGVAQTYRLWKIEGEPFKEKNAYYVNARNPLSKVVKKVRWYTDKAHAELMPQTKSYGPFYKVFGFTSEDSTIIAIRVKDLTQDEIADYFAGKWRMCVLFGEVWYAPMGTELPPIRKATRYFYPTWGEWRAEGQANSKKLDITPQSESPWFKEKTA